MSSFTPREIVSELDRFIIGQNDAKRAVAVALRNRWRRQQIGDDMRDEIVPKNILMIGPTGVGKTEIARRLAKLADAPFIKVEATKFTEVGYVGRDVEQIIRDLVESAVHMVRDQHKKHVLVKAELAAEDRVLDALVGDHATDATRQKFRKMLREGDLDDKEIEIQVRDTSANGAPPFDIPGMPGSQVSMINLTEMLGGAFGTQMKPKKMPVSASYEILIAEEAEKLVDEDALTKEAVAKVETGGIVFLDELDKIAVRAERSGGDVSREGVQRDLLPLIEGTTVSTKRGPVKTDHILFIASGAFHVAKPSDLLPELQGRLPIRVELQALSREDLVRILKEPESSLIRQYTALMAVERVTLVITDDAIEELATLAADINGSVENIGARRLHTVMEKLLETISFEASERGGETITINEAVVRETVSDLAEDADLRKFIL